MLPRILLRLFTLLLPLSATADPEGLSALESKPLVTGVQSMIVTNNPYATEAAQKILHQGGNAVDAAIAAALVLGLTEPQSSGIGGGGYALVYSEADKKLTAYDGRETAPHSANDNWFQDKSGKMMSVQQAILTAKSIGVPGEIALLRRMHQDKGQMPWNLLVLPAMDLALHGFKMSPRLHKLLSNDAKIFANNAHAILIFFANGKPKPIGSVITNPDYAKTLWTIANNPSEFYQGQLADEIIQAINQFAREPLYNKADFASYRVHTYPALCMDYRSRYQVCTVPPSSAGGATLLEMLGIYAANYQGNKLADPEWMYQFLEAAKLAFADRDLYLADPAFVNPPLPELISAQYIKTRSHLVTTHAATTPVAAGIPLQTNKKISADTSSKPPGTTSIAIVDQSGNAVSMTLTVESQFGSHLFTHGFFLNNELTDFSFNARNDKGLLIANRIQPGKRPRSSITPVIVLNKQNRIYAISGSPGGSQIICYVAKNLILMLDMQLTPDKASSSPNLCSTNDTPIIEDVMTPISQLTQLEKKGEKIERKAMVSGVTNIVRRTGGGWYGAADPRREGKAM